jgi:2'-5' RNA ligase
MPREAARRLFFALWPDEPMRQAMVHATRDAVRTSGGRPVPADNLHVTLAFLGLVPDRRRGELAEIARAVGSSAGLPGTRLELAFDHLEHWRAAQLLCALPAEPPAPLAALGRRLQERLAASGFAPDLKPFRPHVTVVRKVSRPGRIGEMHPLAWSFTELALVESRTRPEGALYSVVESYALCGEQNAANNSERP